METILVESGGAACWGRATGFPHSTLAGGPAGPENPGFKQRATGFPHSTSADGPAGPTNPGLKQSLNRFPHATSVDGRPARIIFGKSNRVNRV